MKVKFFVDLNEESWDYNSRALTGIDHSGLSATTYPYKLNEPWERIEFTVDLPDRFFKAGGATITAKVSDVQEWSEEAKIKDLS